MSVLQEEFQVHEAVAPNQLPKPAVSAITWTDDSVILNGEQHHDASILLQQQSVLDSSLRPE